MSHPNQHKLKKVFLIFLSRMNAVLRADYSFADFNISSMKRRILSIRSLHSHFDKRYLMGSFSDFIILGRIRLLYLTALLGLILALIFVLLPYEHALMDRFIMRPAQWGHLQNLIADSNLLTSSTSSRSSYEEFELQDLKVMVLSRDIKPVNLVIISTNPVKIEIKANDVLFSALIDIFDQARIRWGLYPEEFNIEAGNLPGVVTIDGRLVQYLDLEVPSPLERRR